MRDFSDIHRVTIELPGLEITILPRTQIVRLTTLDAAGLPMGRVDEQPLAAVVDVLRGELHKRTRAASVGELEARQ